MSLLRNIGVGKTKLINEWLKQYAVFRHDSTYKINDDYTIDVDGSIELKGTTPNIPDYIQFNKVSGQFSIGGCKEITSLRGCPKECYTFSCYNCKNLTSLEGAPEIVSKFICDGCSKLESLEYCPRSADVFFIQDCGKRFTKKYVRSLCDAKKEILI